MGRIERKDVLRLKTYLAHSLEEQGRFEEAVVAWGEDFPPMQLLQYRSRRCMACKKRIYDTHWPKGLHFCVCGKWHAVCPKCVRQYSMIDRPFAGSWDYQKLDLCVRPVRAARKFLA